eukprot:scaffold11959_cov126-Isochrysis_galbana.AAC.1
MRSDSPNSPSPPPPQSSPCTHGSYRLEGRGATHSTQRHGPRAQGCRRLKCPGPPLPLQAGEAEVEGRDGARRPADDAYAYIDQEVQNMKDVETSTLLWAEPSLMEFTRLEAVDAPAQLPWRDDVRGQAVSM